MTNPRPGILPREYHKHIFYAHTLILFIFHFKKFELVIDSAKPMRVADLVVLITARAKAYRDMEMSSTASEDVEVPEAREGDKEEPADMTSGAEDGPKNELEDATREVDTPTDNNNKDEPKRLTVVMSKIIQHP